MDGWMIQETSRSPSGQKKRIKCPFFFLPVLPISVGVGVWVDGERRLQELEHTQAHTHSLENNKSFALSPTTTTTTKQQSTTHPLPPPPHYRKSPRKTAEREREKRPKNIPRDKQKVLSLSLQSLPSCVQHKHKQDTHTESESESKSATTAAAAAAAAKAKQKQQHFLIG